MVIIREPTLEDRDAFLSAMQESVDFHSQWVKAPLTDAEFDAYLSRYQQANQKSYLVLDQATNVIIGVFNLNEIIRGVFQNAFLGFYVVKASANKGYMSAGLQQVLEAAFTKLGLHRLEANIQPQNLPSIKLVQRNGFRYEGCALRYLKINEEWRDHERWAITYEDWQKIGVNNVK